MHELSIAWGLRAELERLLRVERGARVRRIILVVGTHSGVVPESLRLAVEAVGSESPLLRGMEVAIQERAPEWICAGCGAGAGPVRPPSCARCGSAMLWPRGGDELLLKEVEFETAPVERREEG